MKIELTLNGQATTIEAEPHEFLTEVLRREGLIGTKRGCESGDCGVCAVLVDGDEVASCILLAAQAHGHEVTTIEALGSFDEPSPIQTAFCDTTAVQCGFCTPGMVIATQAYLEHTPDPSPAQARELLAGHICRCTGYVKPLQAVLTAAAATREGGSQ